MNLIDTLKIWDTDLFLFLNGLHSTFFDGFMFAVSAKFTWIPLYVALLYVIIKSKKRESIWLILALVLCVVVADQIASGIIKNAVQRLRPSHDGNLEGLVHLVRGHKSGKYGFVSSHASNTFGLAVLTSLFFKDKTYTTVILLWAILVSYSRIYLGVHYPLDILGGATVGVVVAFVSYLAVVKLRFSALKSSGQNETSFEKLTIPHYVLGASLFLIILYSFFLF